MLQTKAEEEELADRQMADEARYEGYRSLETSNIKQRMVEAIKNTSAEHVYDQRMVYSTGIKESL